MDDKIDFFNVVARKKLGVGADWRWCRSEVIGEPGRYDADFLIEGGVPRTLKSGPNKGKRSWRNIRLLKCVVTRRDLVEAQARYEESTGLCHVCQGSKQTIAGSSRTEGTTYRVCSRCGGTGQASKKAVG